ncbi:MAG TPA: helix-turn-helix domain-containing protein [Solirubrobacterales bacterium]|jgi:transcriptional regulator with XRE-family HTH domain
MPQKKRDVGVAERFGQNLRRERRRGGLTQEELAHRASLHRTEVGRLETGERVPRIDTLIRLADSAATTPEALLDGIQWVPALPAPEVLGAFSFSSWPHRVSRVSNDESKQAREDN